MKTLYLDCGMGAAGDMLSAALLELMPDRQAVLDELNTIGIPQVRYKAEASIKCGITGTHMTVLINGEEEGPADSHEEGHVHGGHDHHEHHENLEHSDGHGHHEHHDHGVEHRTMKDIEAVVNALKVPETVRKNVIKVYGLIAEAESHVHDRPVTEVHFHELGAFDAIADVTAVCLMLDRLSPDRIVASPVHVGSGKVRCAHGILPVPAPATALILKGIPIYGGDIQGELCTPTGAALLKHFADEFGKMPVMSVDAIGYGMGKKDFPAANCVRAMLGNEERRGNEIRYEISANVDDMTGEQVGFAAERIFEAGAADVFTLQAGMKKGRPGILISAICDSEARKAVIEAFFKYTSTIGVREKELTRYVLDRTVYTRETPYGPLRVKRSEGYGVTREKPEYDDLARIALEKGISVAEAAELTSEQ